MGAMLKGEEKLTIQVKGDGPIGPIVVDANAKGEVRGYVKNPHVHLPSNSLGKLDVRGAVGTTGFINVTKDLGLKEPYRGSAPLISGGSARILHIILPYRSKRLPPSVWGFWSTSTIPSLWRVVLSFSCSRV